MKRVIFIALITCFGITSFAQDIVKGRVTDAGTGLPIEGAHVLELKTNNGTTTDRNGYFSLEVLNPKSRIEITHISYRSYQSVVNLNSLLDIRLQSKVNELPPVDIAVARPVNIIKKQPLFIIDYEFIGDSIIMLAYKYRKFNEAYLLMVNNDGDTVSYRPVKKADKLYKDPMDNVHLLTKNEAYQLYYNSAKIDFLYPTDRVEFEEAMMPVVESMDPNIYWKGYYMDDQILVYYAYNTQRKESKEFKVIADEQLLRMREDKGRLLKGAKDHEIRFEELIMYRPVFAPMIKLDTELCILNYADDCFEFYSPEGAFHRSIGVDFHHDPNWKEKVYVDDKTGKVYTLFLKNGYSKLMEINLETGQLNNSIGIPDFAFIENIKVHDDIVYFLYKENSLDEYKQLYKLKL